MSGNDNINMEYEARLILDENEYSRLKEFYTSKYPNYRFIVNENFYFDTKDLYINNHNSMLRVRSIDESKFELTLKIDKPEGCIEINHLLTDKEKNELFIKGIIPKSNIKDKLEKMNIRPGDISLITNLKTERIEIDFEDYLFVLDKNYFRNRVDFNLEVESASNSLAKSKLLAIIAPFNIEYKNGYITKSRRAIYDL